MMGDFLQTVKMNEVIENASVISKKSVFTYIQASFLILKRYIGYKENDLNKLRTSHYALGHHLLPILSYSGIHLGSL